MTQHQRAMTALQVPCSNLSCNFPRLYKVSGVFFKGLTLNSGVLLEIFLVQQDFQNEKTRKTGTETPRYLNKILR